MLISSQNPVIPIDMPRESLSVLLECLEVIQSIREEGCADIPLQTKVSKIKMPELLVLIEDTKTVLFNYR